MTELIIKAIILDFYAKTKALGEVVSEKHLTIRTSVIGPELKEDGRELFNWFFWSFRSFFILYFF